MAQHHIFEPQRYTYHFGGTEPTLTVGDGDTITTLTRDARGFDEHNRPLPDSMKPPAAGYHPLSSNPCVGPFRVEGAEVHDTLAVRIDSIVLNRDNAWSSQGAGMGSLTAEVPGRRLLLNPPLDDQMFNWHLDRERMIGTLELQHSTLAVAEIPLHPFIGSIGVAPRYGRVETTLAPGDFGGNMDCVETRIGTTLYLPIWHEGAMLSFGDIHAAQGDGELCRSALETTAEVTLTVKVIKGWEIHWPRMHDEHWIMTAGSSRPLYEAMQIAQVELLTWLETDYGFERQEGWQLNSQAGRMRIGNVVDPFFTVVAKFPKRLLPA